MPNELCFSILCFVPIPTVTNPKVFGFSEFLAAVALLAVLYTITDVRYRFRIAVTPGSIYKTTFILIACVGLLTLLTDIWILSGWWVPKMIWISPAIWQGILGILFLGTFLTWMYYAFINPPTFGRKNARRYANELYRHILRGNDEDLKIISNELARSAKCLIKYSQVIPGNRMELDNNFFKRSSEVNIYANELLLLIANRKFCRQIVAASPITAKVFFDAIKEINGFNGSIGQFARNISSEAVLQTESFLYSEAEGYYSGLIGYLKPVSVAVYGNYPLLNHIQPSPFDIHYEEQWNWSGNQWNAYCRAILITLKSYLTNQKAFEQPTVLVSAINNLKSAYQDLYKVSEARTTYDKDTLERLRAVVGFITEAIDLIGKVPNPPKPLSNVREGTYPKNIYDYLADLIFDICFTASTVDGTPELCWSIHYGSVWSRLFNHTDDQNKAWRIVHFKVRRLMYDEIVQLSNFANYKGSRLLGFCLNVLGLEERSRTGGDKNTYALSKCVHEWCQKNYLLLRRENKDVAESVLIGSIGIDLKGKRLVKTFAKGLHRTAPKSYLNLNKQ